jgi:hypothetical protein|tara:strand:- start:176 stop:364 length:189 start_codon:yes stop_codon:yes gene_type:complete
MKSQYAVVFPLRGSSAADEDSQVGIQSSNGTWGRGRIELGIKVILGRRLIGEKPGFLIFLYK